MLTLAKATLESLTFDFDSRDQIELKDGTRAYIRLVCPSDKSHLIRGFGRLSPESRYMRFMGAKQELSAKELRYLTEVDQLDHFAIGAMRVLPDGSEDGIGIARLIRLREEPAVAEAAVAVIDEMQGKGLGRHLLKRLAEAAHERGIERLRCELFANNRRVRALLEELAEQTFASEEDGVVTLDLTLPTPTVGERMRNVLLRSGLSRAFKLVASGRLHAGPTRGPPAG